MTHSLVLLAGGKSQRFGRSKQLEPVGPNKETLLEYSIYDALQNGFRRVVIVTSPDNLTALESSLQHLQSRIEMHFVVQENTLRARSKPLGTAHALLSAAKHLGESFAVLNADDFYGQSAFRRAAEFMSELRDDEHKVGLLAFQLCNTIHNSNPVSRALCVIGKDGQLESLTELTVTWQESAGYSARDASDALSQLSGSERISMNFWVMTPAIVSAVTRAFESFLADASNTEDAEFALPDVVQSLSAARSADVGLIIVDGKTFGLSYPSDKTGVVAHLALLHQQEDYPTPLWSSER